MKKEFKIPEGLSQDTIVKTKKGKEFTIGEIQNSNRVYKSATPKQDLSWYIKWISSFFVLIAVACRAAGGDLAIYDLAFSTVGTAGWLWVGLLWNDRALIMLNAALFMILASGLLKILVG